LGTIANPYAMVVYKGVLYVVDFDGAAIEAVNMSNYTLIKFGPRRDPAYMYSNSGWTNSGIDLEVVGDDLYALFASSSSYGSSTPWSNSMVVQLNSGSTPASLQAIGQVMVGMNATGMAQVVYQPPNEASESTFLLVSCIGGNQQYGAGNGQNSRLDVVRTGANFALVGTAVTGTYARDGLDLDVKAVTATPTDSNGKAYVYVMASSMTQNYMNKWIVCQTTAKYLIDAAISGSPVTLNPGVDMLLVNGSIVPGNGDYGAFWTVIYVSEGSGINGKLIVGRGNGNGGDSLEIYPVGANGFSTPAVTIADSTLYGSSGVINTLTVVPPAAVSGVTTKVKRAVTKPSSIAAGVSSMGDFLPNILKKLAEEKA
jgi:hypothetical protein